MRGQTCLGSGLWRCRSGSTSGHRPAAHLAVPAAAAESRGAGEERGREGAGDRRTGEEEDSGRTKGSAPVARGFSSARRGIPGDRERTCSPFRRGWRTGEGDDSRGDRTGMRKNRVEDREVFFLSQSTVAS